MTEKDLMNNAFKTAVGREERFISKYFFWSKRVRDKELAALFSDFAVASRSRVAKIKKEMNKYNIK